MVLFAVTLVVALLGVGAYDLYNPGTLSITMAGYQFVAVPVWVPVALGAAAPLSLFLLHALWTGARIWFLKGAARRARAWDDPERWPSVKWPAAQLPVERWPVEPRQAERWPAEERRPVQAPAYSGRRRRASQAPRPVGPQPAPKRSWLTHRD